MPRLTITDPYSIRVWSASLLADAGYLNLFMAGRAICGLTGAMLNELPRLPDIDIRHAESCPFKSWYEFQ